jgi:membrane-associated phospholipid phosphatase
VIASIGCFGRGRWLRFLAMTAAVFLAASSPARADAVLDWNVLLLDVIRQMAFTPPVASREMAIMNTAVYDAVSAASGLLYRPYHYDGAPVLGASPEAATAAAAYRVLSSLDPELSWRAPGLAARMRALYEREAGAPTASVKAGVALGEQQASAILALRAHDGFDAMAPPYLGSAKPGAWRPTPPGMEPGMLPQWAKMTPWTMTSPSQFRAPGPPRMTSAAWAGSLNMTQALGSADGTLRTPARTEIALFWADDEGTETPPGHWLDIAIGIATRKHLELLDNARLMAMLSTAEADAAIVAWDTKYTYSTWRPVTAIAAAADSGNTEVTPDPNWMPLLTTPPFPEYISGHSAFSGTAATILARFFGDDRMAFTAHTDAPQLRGVERRFTSFSQAAEEAGMSRIYGGIHFLFSHRDGIAAGTKLAQYVFDNFFQPVAPISASVNTRCSRATATCNFP